MGSETATLDLLIGREQKTRWKWGMSGSPKRVGKKSPVIAASRFTYSPPLPTVVCCRNFCSSKSEIINIYIKILYLR